jgi:RNA polymerase sigma factor (sigma-70 family)
MRTSDTLTRDVLDRIVATLRPKLYRYCARITGSAVDGEDVVQDALLKAVEAAEREGRIAHPETWLFRIAHNAAIDFLRRRARQASLLVRESLLVDGELETFDELAQRQATAASLRTFTCANWFSSLRMRHCPLWPRGRKPRHELPRCGGAFLSTQEHEAVATVGVAAPLFSLSYKGAGNPATTKAGVAGFSFPRGTRNLRGVGGDGDNGLGEYA